MSRKPLTLTVSTPIRVEDLLAALGDEKLSRLRLNVWQGKRVIITITEHQPTEQDYLNAAITDGLLCETPDAEYPYTWNSKVTNEWVSEFVARVCVRLGYAQPWRWAKELFGLNNLRQLNNNLSNKQKNTRRYKNIVNQVTDLLDNA